VDVDTAIDRCGGLREHRVQGTPDPDSAGVVIQPDLEVSDFDVVAASDMTGTRG
jgi:hypothetical protein